MHAPDPWPAILMALASYRLARLAGWDAWPPAARVRAWVTGEEWVRGDKDVILPGKTPESAVDEVRPGYRRPVLAHLIHCPYCMGAWLSFGVYMLWLWMPEPTLCVAAPFALSAVAALIAKNLDK